MTLLEVTTTLFVLGTVFQDRPSQTLPFRAWVPYKFKTVRIYKLAYTQQLVTIAIAANVNIGRIFFFFFFCESLLNIFQFNIYFSRI